MHITEIITVSPVNPAHGRHEIHARTAEGVDVAFQISPDALGCLTGYFNSFPPGDKAYEKFTRKTGEASTSPPKKKGQ